MVIFLQARGTDWSTKPVLCLRFSDWPISIHNWVYIFHRVLSDPDSDAIVIVQFFEMFSLLSPNDPTFHPTFRPTFFFYFVM